MSASPILLISRKFPHITTGRPLSLRLLHLGSYLPTQLLFRWASILLPRNVLLLPVSCSFDKVAYIRKSTYLPPKEPSHQWIRMMSTCIPLSHMCPVWCLALPPPTSSTMWMPRVCFFTCTPPRLTTSHHVDSIRPRDQQLGKLNIFPVCPPCLYPICNPRFPYVIHVFPYVIHILPYVIHVFRM